MAINPRVLFRKAGGKTLPRSEYANKIPGAFSVFRIPSATRPKQFLLSCWIDVIAARFPTTAGGAGTGLNDVRASSTRANDSLSHDLGIDRAGGKLAK